MKNRYIVIALAFLFGWAGAHKFYLGKYFQGFLHIIAPPIGWIVAVIEGVKYLTMSNDEFDIQYNLSGSQKALLAEEQRLKRQRLINERKALERQHFLEEQRFKEELEKKNQERIPITGEMADQLAAWHDLKEQGIISEFEYEEKRREILRQE